MCQLENSLTGSTFMSKLEVLREQKNGKLTPVHVIFSGFDCLPHKVPAIIYFSEFIVG